MAFKKFNSAGAHVNARHICLPSHCQELMEKCSSGKRGYASAEIAEEALLEANIQYEFGRGKGPVTFYRCENCGQYHLTSQGTMNERLAAVINSGKLNRLKEATRWTRKFGKR